MVIGFWDVPGGGRSEEVETEGTRYAESVSALVDLVGREADEREHSAQPVRYLDAAANA
jgi:hypothetical protein